MTTADVAEDDGTEAEGPAEVHVPMSGAELEAAIEREGRFAQDVRDAAHG